MPAPMKVSGAPPTSFPDIRARSSKARPSSFRIAMGFSVYTDLPCSNAARAIPACAAGMVRLMTISMSGSFSRASAVRASTPSNSAALARDRSGTMSAHATTSKASNLRPASKYTLLMLPHPMIPALSADMGFRFSIAIKDTGKRARIARRRFNSLRNGRRLRGAYSPPGDANPAGQTPTLLTRRAAHVKRNVPLDGPVIA